VTRTVCASASQELRGAGGKPREVNHQEAALDGLTRLVDLPRSQNAKE
jgi:hypothetical protein